MPVIPSTVGRYSSYTPYSSYSSYRSPSSGGSSYLNCTTSLERGASSSYSSGPSYSGSSYVSKYSSRPPRASYTSSYSSDASRATRSHRVSPARGTSYSRISSDTHLQKGKDVDADNISSSTSRYSSTLSRYRDASSGRDSGYGSRITSRDHSADLINGNAFDTSHFGPSASSYVSNYRWDAASRALRSGNETNDDVTPSLEKKIAVSERIRAFESKPDPTEERLAQRRRRLGLSPVRDKSRTPTPRRVLPRPPSPSPPRSNSPSLDDRKPSVSDLCRKYDSNLNLTNGVLHTSTDNEEVPPALDAMSGISGGATCGHVPSPPPMPPVARPESPTITKRTRRRTDSTRCESPSNTDTIRDNLRLDSPVRGKALRGSPRHVSPAGEEDRGSKTVLNGMAEKSATVSSHSHHLDSDDSSSYLSSRSRFRRDRIRDRVAARLASELEDDHGSPPPRRRSPTGDSTHSFSENSGLVGLRNIGNTCFLNSITQCLSNTRCLMEYLGREDYSSDINMTLSTMKGDLVRAFASLLSDMWREGGLDTSRALNTGPFKSQIQRFAPVFSGYAQHDAQEFLRKLLEGLHEDVNRVTVKPRPITQDIDDNLDDDQKAMEAWKRYLRYDDSKIVDMFVGQLKSCLQCSVCGHCSVTFDPFWDLSLPIPSKAGTVRLAQCIDLFTKEEVLEGDERPTCSRCKERRKMTKSFSIQKFPRVLVLHLKRFSPHERWRGKLSCSVEFPHENLDLSNYSANQSTSSHYKLIGIANHSGTTYSGHYTAYCRHPYSGSWHEYNDSRVSSISPNRLCSSEAYVLFYELANCSKL